MGSRRVGSKSGKTHKYARTHQNLKKRKPDPDQIVSHVVANWRPELDDELPAGGAFYCPACARHFLDAKVLETHYKSKPHKRALKRAKEDLAHPYTNKDATFYAGKSFE